MNAQDGIEFRADFPFISVDFMTKNNYMVTNPALYPHWSATSDQDKLDTLKVVTSVYGLPAIARVLDLEEKHPLAYSTQAMQFFPTEPHFEPTDMPIFAKSPLLLSTYSPLVVTTKEIQKLSFYQFGLLLSSKIYKQSFLRLRYDVALADEFPNEVSGLFAFVAQVIALRPFTKRMFIPHSAAKVFAKMLGLKWDAKKVPKASEDITEAGRLDLAKIWAYIEVNRFVFFVVIVHVAKNCFYCRLRFLLETSRCTMNCFL